MKKKMGKEGDLWDDSALIDAFDQAISKYKMMHSKGHHHDSSTEGEKVISSTEENLSVLIGESHETKRHIETDDNNNDASTTTAEMREANNLPAIKEDHCLNSYVTEAHAVSSNGQETHDVAQSYSNTQVAEYHTQLLSQYYELEEQRQTILQQLHQFDAWNYQGFTSTVQGGCYSTSQEHHVPTTQASFPAAICSCCPYANQCLVAPCSLCGTNDSKTSEATPAVCCEGKSFSLENGDIVKTAMEAAERALSSLKMKDSGDSNVLEGKKKETNEEQSEQSAGSETDLTVVLNAWYSAGFYTGKYLAERSAVMKRHG